MEMYNKASETAIIAILLNSSYDAIIEILNQLTPSDFGTVHLGVPIYSNLLQIVRNIVTQNEGSVKADRLTSGTLIAEIEKYPKLYQTLGGQANINKNLVGLKNHDVHVGELQHHIDEVKKYSTARKIISQSDALKQKLSMSVGEMTTDDILAEVEKIKIEVNSEAEIEGGHISTGIDRYLDVPEDNIGKLLGVPSRWETLNKLHYGYQSKTLTIWSSFTNMGKSIVLLNEADYIGIDQQIPVLYIDTEMSSHQQLPRLISMRCGHQSQGDPRLWISPRDVKLGLYQYNKSKTAFVKDQVQAIKNGKLYFCSLDTFDEESLARLIKYYTMKHGIELVIFDYIKMPRVNANSGLNETQMLGNLVETIKNGIAKRLDKPIISAAQTDQKEKDRVADSARLQRYCDMLINWRKKDVDQQQRGSHEGFIQKSREDQRDVSINFKFLGSTSAIVEGINDHIKTEQVA